MRGFTSVSIPVSRPARMWLSRRPHQPRTYRQPTTSCCITQSPPPEPGGGRALAVITEPTRRNNGLCRLLACVLFFSNSGSRVFSQCLALLTFSHLLVAGNGPFSQPRTRRYVLFFQSTLYGSPCCSTANDSCSPLSHTLHTHTQTSGAVFEAMCEQRF